ncbi:MAG: hypothetical protein EOP04_08690 [Proteobacteria bacterium]|nr:MAG: hypothetical protein EOP04_08690 [Pseudomonadota bacterium]
MQKFAVSIMGLFLASTASFAVAATHDEQTELDLQAAALVQVGQGQADEGLSLFGIDIVNPFTFLDGLKTQVEGVKETLLLSFDADGNGKIDPGTETENFKEGIKAIALVLGDTNQNGKIDAEDIVSLSETALLQVQGQILTKVCPGVERQAQLAGIFLAFRPVLSKMNDICVAHDAAN